MTDTPERALLRRLVEWGDARWAGTPSDDSLTQIHADARALLAEPEGKWPEMQGGSLTSDGVAQGIPFNTTPRSRAEAEARLDDLLLKHTQYLNDLKDDRVSVDDFEYTEAIFDEARAALLRALTREGT